MPKIRSRTKQRWRKIWNEDRPAKFTYQRHKDAEGNVVPDQYIFFNLAGEPMFKTPMHCTQEEALRLVNRLNEIPLKDLGTVGQRSIGTWCKQVDERRSREYEQISKETEKILEESKGRRKPRRKVAKGSALSSPTVS